MAKLQKKRGGENGEEKKGEGVSKKAMGGWETSNEVRIEKEKIT